MKIQLFPALLFATALLGGCATPSHTKFTDLHDSQVYPGKSGEESSVDDMIFWINGDPDQSYRILGIIDLVGSQKHHHGFFSSLSSGDEKAAVDPEGEVAKLAKQNGGDAVVVVRENQRTADSAEFGSGGYLTRTRYVVIKYVP